MLLDDDLADGKSARRNMPLSRQKKRKRQLMKQKPNTKQVLILLDEARHIHSAPYYKN